MCQVKLCKYCNIEKDISEFSKDKKGECGCQSKYDILPWSKEPWVSQ
jgi:hypothetical protein